MHAIVNYIRMGYPKMNICLRTQNSIFTVSKLQLRTTIYITKNYILCILLDETNITNHWVRSTRSPDPSSSSQVDHRSSKPIRQGQLGGYNLPPARCGLVLERRLQACINCKTMTHLKHAWSHTYNRFIFLLHLTIVILEQYYQYHPFYCLLRTVYVSFMLIESIDWVYLELIFSKND